MAENIPDTNHAAKCFTVIWSELGFHGACLCVDCKGGEDASANLSACRWVVWNCLPCCFALYSGNLGRTGLGSRCSYLGLRERISERKYAWPCCHWGLSCFISCVKYLPGTSLATWTVAFCTVDDLRTVLRTCTKMRQCYWNNACYWDVL